MPDINFTVIGTEGKLAWSSVSLPTFYAYHCKVFDVLNNLLCIIIWIGASCAVCLSIKHIFSALSVKWRDSADSAGL